mmetsp:Transcript_72849/g.140895  ORF Transcript_72849/g.140895 Transcript_72849/m.140895 type:complete len:204 (-) Transcript_72849:13-624(-)
MVPWAVSFPRGSLHDFFVHVGEASRLIHTAFLEMGIKESAICFPQMAKATSEAYVELDRAEQALSVANHAVQHDSRAAVDAAEKTETALQLLRPVAEFSQKDELEVDGPHSVDIVESVQSNARLERIGGSKPGVDATGATNQAQGSSALPLLPAALSLLLMQTRSTLSTPSEFERRDDGGVHLQPPDTIHGHRRHQQQQRQRR